MKESTKTALMAWVTIVVMAGFMAILIIINGCASIKYGTDREYVMAARNPLYIGTQVNAVKLMADKGSLQAALDIIPSAAADTAMLPWYLGLYWWHDKTEIGGPGINQ